MPGEEAALLCCCAPQPVGCEAILLCPTSYAISILAVYAWETGQGDPDCSEFDPALSYVITLNASVVVTRLPNEIIYYSQEGINPGFCVGNSGTFGFQLGAFGGSCSFPYPPGLCATLSCGQVGSDQNFYWILELSWLENLCFPEAPGSLILASTSTVDYSCAEDAYGWHIIAADGCFQEVTVDVNF